MGKKRKNRKSRGDRSNRTGSRGDGGSLTQKDLDGLQRAIESWDQLSSADDILSTKGHPEVAGMVLEPVQMRLLDRDGGEYKQVCNEYAGYRKKYCKGLAQNPTTRALALLAVGKGGVRELEAGRVPQGFNRHHIFQKSAATVDPDHRKINDFSNLVLLDTNSNPSRNPHHFLHGAILHSQTNEPAGTVSTVYNPRPAFPIYPPITQAFKSTGEVKAHLESLEKGSSQNLPDSWAKKIVAFSEATDHKRHAIPEQFHNLVKGFSNIYSAGGKDEQKRRRDELAKDAEKVTASYVPAGAVINGKKLPADHQPSVHIPRAPKQWNPEVPKKGQSFPQERQHAPEMNRQQAQDQSLKRWN